LMREILQAYFFHEYSSFPFFQLDLFLDDALAETGRFCSSLLMNAVLAHGYVSIQTDPTASSSAQTPRPPLRSEMAQV
jgi:hypothetical protein